MRQSRLIMGMPVYLEIVGGDIPTDAYEDVFDYFTSVDERFSTYKGDSEVSRMNRGEIAESDYSEELREVLRLADETKRSTNGYFDIRRPDGTIDPSGIVKGWALQKAAEMLLTKGYTDFYLEIAGDIQTSGHDAEGKEWSVGIRNPFNSEEIVKVLYPKGKGVATSGTYIRGEHIYNPRISEKPTAYISLTVIGPNIYEADRFATAAFAMGEAGMPYLEKHSGLEAYAIDRSGMATFTSGFETYTAL